MRRSLGGGYELDDDRLRIDIGMVHAFLSQESYWARGRSRQTVERLVREASRVVGVYEAGFQVGFSRVVSDGQAFAWLADVFVLPDHRGRGLGVELVREAVDEGAQRYLPWVLSTADAHGLYAKFGFGPPPDQIMYRPRTVR